MPAYDECYLNGMFQKHRYLFKLIGRNRKDAFKVIMNYMNSDYRRNMGEGNPLFLNKTPKQILHSMNISIDGNAPMSEELDEFILEWMADIYTYMQWKYNVPSGELASKLKPEDLYSKYYPLHETSVENGAEKLRIMVDNFDKVEYDI